MGLVDDVRAAMTGPGVQCSIPGIFTANPEIADELRSVLADRSLHSTAIMRVLKSRGITIADNTLQRHRRGDCKC